MQFHDEIEEIDEAYVAQQRQAQEEQSIAQHAMTTTAVPAGLPTYPLALADGEAAATESFITRRLGPLPVWGWGLTAAGLGALGYFMYKSAKEVEPNDGGETEPARLPARTSSGKWEPSRRDFADKLEPWLATHGLGSATVYRDADDAAKKLKHVSPLVTMKCTGKVPLKELEKFCKAEGLHPIEHEGGVVGFYPGKGQRGKAWEEYVDLLRDDGQEL